MKKVVAFAGRGDLPSCRKTTSWVRRGDGQLEIDVVCLSGGLDMAANKIGVEGADQRPRTLRFIAVVARYLFVAFVGFRRAEAWLLHFHLDCGSPKAKPALVFRSEIHLDDHQAGGLVFESSERGLLQPSCEYRGARFTFITFEHVNLLWRQWSLSDCCKVMEEALEFGSSNASDINDHRVYTLLRLFLGKLYTFTNGDFTQARDSMREVRAWLIQTPVAECTDLEVEETDSNSGSFLLNR